MQLESIRRPRWPQWVSDGAYIPQCPGSKPGKRAITASAKGVAENLRADPLSNPSNVIHPPGIICKVNARPLRPRFLWYIDASYSMLRYLFVILSFFVRSCKLHVWLLYGSTELYFVDGKKQFVSRRSQKCENYILVFQVLWYPVFFKMIPLSYKLHCPVSFNAASTFLNFPANVSQLSKHFLLKAYNRNEADYWISKLLCLAIVLL